MNFPPSDPRPSQDYLMRLVALFLTRGLGALISLLCCIATPALAANYSDNGDGTVTDSTTGLTWTRCSMGQTWDGSACAGTPAKYTWTQANALTGQVSFGGYSDWRLPNIRELQTIVDLQALSISVYPSIDGATFPNTPASYFWSTSTSAYNSNSGWDVDFYSGASNQSAKISTFHVRLVRAGQSLDLSNVARLTSDYVDNGDGTVTHVPTSLMWKRCAEGQNWDGTTCTGTAISVRWDAAIAATTTFAGKSDWRLPIYQELLSLVDFASYNPAINAAIFPATPALNFWSAWVYADRSVGGVSPINFSYGGSLDGAMYNLYPLRLVRPGQPLGSYVSTTTTVAGTTTTTQAGPTVTRYLVAGWNLIGNSSSAALNPEADLGDTSKVMTAWKWIADAAKWAFYAPSLLGQALSDYATSKGYDTLTTVNVGEGFWVNAKSPFAAQLFSGTKLQSSAVQNNLVTGWNLLGNGLNRPFAASTLFGDTNVVNTVWKWDTTTSGWQFYTPSLTSVDLQTYATSKGYAVLTQIKPYEGYWVNAKAAASIPSSPTELISQYMSKAYAAEQTLLASTASADICDGHTFVTWRLQHVTRFLNATLNYIRAIAINGPIDKPAIISLFYPYYSTDVDYYSFVVQKCGITFSNIYWSPLSNYRIYLGSDYASAYQEVDAM